MSKYINVLIYCLIITSESGIYFKTKRKRFMLTKYKVVPQTMGQVGQSLILALVGIFLTKSYTI